jgi:hypothetical protein
MAEYAAKSAYKFSPSRLSLLADCPRCFWLSYRKGIERPSGIFPSLPSGMDKIFKEHFDSFRDRGELPPELAGLKGTVRLFQDQQLLEEWRDSYRGVSWTDSNGNMLRGAVDNILQKDDKLIVLDYKTRGFPVTGNYASYYQDQMDFYNFLLRKKGYKTENYAYLLVYHPVKVKATGEILFHTDLLKLDVNVDNAERIFRKALDVLNGDMPEADKECEYCQWAAERNGKI